VIWRPDTHCGADRTGYTHASSAPAGGASRPHCKRLWPGDGSTSACWVCFFPPDEPFSSNPRAYGTSPSQAATHLLNLVLKDGLSSGPEERWAKRMVRIQQHRLLQASGKVSVPLHALLQAPLELSRPQCSTSETPLPPVAMTDGLHRRVAKILGTFLRPRCKRNL